jgi:2',3'-cyclic-nucleotide 2'-phosphodiesterase / 3'-nucleotidase / 5'-nucleotidase
MAPLRYLPILPLLIGACARPAVVPDRSAPASVDLVIAATTDVHGRLRAWDYYANAAEDVRGLARAATIIDSVRAANPARVVLVDAGDLLQGNPMAYVAARVRTDMPHPVIAAMNVMRYDAAALGNHEFNYGLSTLERALREATFPFLAANAYTPDGRRAYAASTVVERQGVRVAIVGATTPGSMIWDRDNLRGRVVLRDIILEVRTAVADARRNGADVVIVTMHSGLNEPSSYDTVATGVPSENVAARVAREVPGIDLIVFGHSHKELADTVIGSTMLMQPKNWATSVAVAHLGLEREARGWRVRSKRGTLVRVMGHAESPSVVAVVDAAHRATIAYATTPIGTTPVAWRADSARVTDTPLIDFILEVERKATGAQLASTAAFSLDASLAAGPITVARLAALYPYENTLRSIRISGAQLKDYLEHSARYYRTYGSGAPIVNDSVPGYNFDVVAGADYVLDLSRPVGERVTHLEVNGRAVAPGDSFSFALNNYRHTGGGGFAMLAGAPVLHDEQQEIRQLLIDEVRRIGVLRPEDYFRRNWRIVPAAAVSEAYAHMNRASGERSGGPAGTPAAPTARRTLPSGPRLRIIGTNDFHGALEPRPDNAGIERGGAGVLAAAVQQAQRECAPPQCQSVLVDGGDMFQGTPASNLSFGRPVIDVFNAMGYAAAALGNHDLDWGQDTLRAIMRAARFPILGANVRDAQGRDVRWIPNDTIVRRGPYQVGIIGVAWIETPSVTKASNVVGLRFDDPVPIIDSIAPALRARGADAVVVLTHSGAFCDRDAASNCRGDEIDIARRITAKVDAIIGGHTHSAVNTVVNGMPVVQARSRGQAIDVVDIPLPGASGAAAQELRNVVSDSLTPVASIDSIVTRAVSRIAGRINRPIATIAEDMPRQGSQYALGNLIADAMRLEGKGDVGIMNNGGIRAGLRSGSATYGLLYEVMPFANVLYRVSVNGADLRKYLEMRVRRGSPSVHVSGVAVEYDTLRAPGNRITSLQVGGTPLRDERTYTVVINDFMLGDTLGFGAAATRAESANLVDLDALIQHLRALPQPVVAPKAARFILRTPQ